MEGLGNILQRPTEDIRRKIEKELGVDAVGLEKNVQVMEEWIREQRHLPQDCDSKIIESFVVMTKNNSEKARSKFEASVVSRTKFKDVYETRSIADDAFVKSMAHAYFCVLPGYTKDGCRVVIMHLIDRNTDHADIKMAMKYVTMIGDLQMCYDIMAGHIVIIDFNNFTASHMKKLNLFDIRKAVYLLQNAYPARIRQIHLINANSLTEKLVLLVKPFLKNKLKNRIMLHKNVESLSKFVPMHMLPKDYGGKGDSTTEICEDWRRFFTQHTDWSRKVDRMKLVDSQIIENFVRMTKNNLEKAKTKFEASVVSRTKFKDVYETRSIEEDIFAKTMAHTIFCILPGYTKDGNRVVLTQLVDRNSDHVDVKVALKYLTMIGDLQMCCDVLAGHIVIMDFANFTASHLKKMNLFDIRKAIYLIQNAYPARIKQVHLINANSFTEKLVLLVKPFLKEKLRKRIIVHKNEEGLAKFVPMDMLPKNYGGKEKLSLEICEDWRRFFVQHTEWSRKVDQMKLAGEIPKQKAALYSFDEFSMEGSFRQLDID